MQEEESSVYPQLVELQQQLQQQLGKRVELSRWNLFCVFFVVLRIFWSFLLMKICGSYYFIGSKHIKSVCQLA